MEEFGNCGEDLVLSGTAADGAVRLIGAETTHTVAEAVLLHQTAPTASAALGRVLTGAVLLSKELKNDTDRLTVQVKGRGPIGGITAVSRVATRNGAAGDLSGIYVKGYAENPAADLPLRESDHKLDVGGIVGKGFLSVITDLGLKEPYLGSVPLVSGEIAEDLSYYYAMSKQIPAAVSLGVLINPDLSVRKAGGFLLQLLPGAPESLIADLEARVTGMPSVTTMLNAGASMQEILEDILHGYSIEFGPAASCAYRCDCSRDRMERAVCSIDPHELQQILQEDHGLEICCHFCNRKYEFTENDIAKKI